MPGGIRNVDSAGKLDVVNPLADVGLILAGEVPFHELPQEFGGPVLLEISRFRTFEIAGTDRGRRAVG